MSMPAFMRMPAPPIQITTSPYQGKVDFSALQEPGASSLALDQVSIADLLRNAFVYPPYSIYRDVKIACFGFDPAQDLSRNADYRFAYRASPSPPRPAAKAVDKSVLLDTYHRLLCDAVARSTAGMHAPWLLQSGGKDSTSLAIALAEVRPQTTCITYLGGREENEIASAQAVARHLGLRHDSLVCNPGRAYDRYLAMVPRLPLLSADFAILSYVDLTTEIAGSGGDGLVDGLGSDIYFGTPVDARRQVLTLLARRLKLPARLFESRWVKHNFKLCFALSTLEMDAFERYFPGSRFNNAEVDRLFGRPIAAASRQRIETFRHELEAANNAEAQKRLSLVIAEAGAAFAKGQYTTCALGLRQAYPYCDALLSDWVYHQVPQQSLIDRHGHNKALVREHIARHFGGLPYVKAKGSFRFDLCGLARERFDQVHAFATATQHLLPGATHWLETHRSRLDNKYFASKFYLLAIILPWLQSRMHGAPPASRRSP
jgi:hypothetical protein